MHIEVRERSQTGSRVLFSWFVVQGCSSYYCSPILCVNSSLAEVIARTYFSCSSSSSFWIPAANQTPTGFRISRTGLTQVLGGSGERKSLILKSPSASRATPARVEL